MKLIHILAIMAIEAVLLCAGVSVASRNSSGTMSGINGPYVGGTVINSATLNARFSDIETEITDSASRSGKGGFTAPVRGADGTVTAPTFAFTSETGTGLYRIGSSDLGVAINQSKKLELTSSLFTVTPAITLTGGVTGLLTATLAGSTAIKALSGASGSATDISLGRTATEGRFGVSAAANNYAAGSAAGDLILGTLGTKLWFDTNTGSGTPSLAIAAANGGVIIGGGTAISKFLRGTTSWTPGTITTLNTVTTTVSLTGAAAGATCIPSWPTAVGLNLAILYCDVSADTCTLHLSNPTAGNVVPSSGTFSCAVINP